MIEKRDTVTDNATASQRNAEIKKENPQPQENKMEGIRGEHAPIDRENLASCQQDQRQETSTEKTPPSYLTKKCRMEFRHSQFRRPPPEKREKLLRAAVSRAAEQIIPRGCHHQNTPYLPAEIREMIEK